MGPVLEVCQTRMDFLLAQLEGYQLKLAINLRITIKYLHINKATFNVGENSLKGCNNYKRFKGD